MQGRSGRQRECHPTAAPTRDRARCIGCHRRRTASPAGRNNLTSQRVAYVAADCRVGSASSSTDWRADINLVPLISKCWRSRPCPAGGRKKLPHRAARWRNCGRDGVRRGGTRCCPSYRPLEERRMGSTSGCDPQQQCGDECPHGWNDTRAATH